jgi:hypothetical protein
VIWFPESELSPDLFMIHRSYELTGTIESSERTAVYEGVASGYWTLFVKQSSGFHQPLGFDSLALLLGHSTYKKQLDKDYGRTIIEVFDKQRSVPNVLGPG